MYQNTPAIPSLRRAGGEPGDALGQPRGLPLGRPVVAAVLLARLQLPARGGPAQLGEQHRPGRGAGADHRPARPARHLGEVARLRGEDVQRVLVEEPAGARVDQLRQRPPRLPEQGGEDDPRRRVGGQDLLPGGSQQRDVARRVRHARVVPEHGPDARREARGLVPDLVVAHRHARQLRVLGPERPAAAEARRDLAGEAPVGGRIGGRRPLAAGMLLRPGRRGHDRQERGDPPARRGGDDALGGAEVGRKRRVGLRLAPVEREPEALDAGAYHHGRLRIERRVRAVDQRPVGHRAEEAERHLALRRDGGRGEDGDGHGRRAEDQDEPAHRPASVAAGRCSSVGQSPG